MKCVICQADVNYLENTFKDFAYVGLCCLQCKQYGKRLPMSKWSGVAKIAYLHIMAILFQHNIVGEKELNLAIRKVR